LLLISMALLTELILARLTIRSSWASNDELRSGMLSKFMKAIQDLMGSLTITSVLAAMI